MSLRGSRTFPQTCVSTLCCLSSAGHSFDLMACIFSCWTFYYGGQESSMHCNLRKHLFLAWCAANTRDTTKYRKALQRNTDHNGNASSGLQQPLRNKPWFYYSKRVVAFFWYIDNLYIYYICINTMVKHFVSVAKPWLICGYLGLTIGTLYLFIFFI